MNILYIAASCAPYSGSEDKIGWNVPMYSAKKHRVFVLTFERQREYIEAYLKKNPADNPTFYYVDIPEIWKKLFRGPFFSGRMNIWHRRAMKIAEEICRKEEIDIVHQITPVEFRSIGPYGKIPRVKFVCGPIAGGQRTPEMFHRYTKGHRMLEHIRAAVNALSKGMLRLNGRLKHCDYLFLANGETESYLQSLFPENIQKEILTDVSVAQADLIGPVAMDHRAKERTFRFLSVGRLVYLKGHSFLLDALAAIPKELDYECRIVGSGPELDFLRKKSLELGLENRIVFCGLVPHREIASVYRDADVFVMPSFREATGSVLLEAMAQGLPVVTINRFGGAAMLDENTGWLYGGNTPEEALENLTAALVECLTSPDEVRRRGANARTAAEAYTWDRRLERYEAVYESVKKPMDKEEMLWNL